MAATKSGTYHIREEQNVTYQNNGKVNDDTYSYCRCINYFLFCIFLMTIANGQATVTKDPTGGEIINYVGTNP